MRIMVCGDSSAFWDFTVYSVSDNKMVFYLKCFYLIYLVFYIKREGGEC